MNSKSLYLALTEIGRLTSRETMLWRLNDSVNLYLQAVPISPMNLDIATNPSGFQKFEKVLKKYSPVKSYSEKAKVQSLKCRIANIDIEILSYEDNRAMLSDIIPISWSRLILPGISIKDARKFYEIIQNQERINIIDKFIFHLYENKARANPQKP